MQYDCLQLYQRAQTAPLQVQEVTWLTQQVNDFPYFALPHLILARHYSMDRSEMAQQQLLTSSTYSVNRSLMQEYMLAPVAKGAEAVRENETAIQAAESTEEVTDHTSSGLSVAAATVAVAAAVGSSTAEEVDAKEEAEPAPVDPINWYLNTQVKLRAARYRGLGTKIKGEIQFFAEKAASQLAESKRNQIEKEEVTFSRAPVKPRFERSEPKSETKVETPGPKSYEIGSFSSFSFVEDQEVAAPEEKEIDTTVAPVASVAFQTPPNPAMGISELIFEEEDRILEVTVTAEELEKYFKGQLPQSFKGGFSSTRLEFDFHSTATGELKESTETSEKETLSGQEADKVEEKETAMEVALDKEESEEKIIDRFIENDPSISRIDEYKGNKDDLSKKSGVESDEWVTETLANIYAMQGNNAKAIRIYKKLSLIFPEKSSYFDDQIAKLKK